MIAMRFLQLDPFDRWGSFWKGQEAYARQRASAVGDSDYKSDVCPSFGSKEFVEKFPPKDMEDLYSRGERAAAHGYGD